MTNEEYEKENNKLQTKVFFLEQKVDALKDVVDNYKLELNNANVKVAYLRGYIHGIQEDTYDETII